MISLRLCKSFLNNFIASGFGNIASSANKIFVRSDIVIVLRSPFYLLKNAEIWQ